MFAQILRTEIEILSNLIDCDNFIERQCEDIKIPDPKVNRSKVLSDEKHKRRLKLIDDGIASASRCKLVDDAKYKELLDGSKIRKGLLERERGQSFNQILKAETGEVPTFIANTEVLERIRDALLDLERLLSFIPKKLSPVERALFLAGQYLGQASGIRDGSQVGGPDPGNKKAGRVRQNKPKKIDPFKEAILNIHCDWQDEWPDEHIKDSFWVYLSEYGETYGLHYRQADRQTKHLGRPGDKIAFDGKGGQITRSLSAVRKWLPRTRGRGCGVSAQKD